MPSSGYSKVEDEKDVESGERAGSGGKETIPMPAHIEFNADKILNRIDAVRGSVSIGLLGSNAAEVTDLEFSLLGVAITELLAAFFYFITVGIDYLYKRKEKRNLLAAKRLQHYEQYTKSRLEKAARYQFYAKPSRTRRNGLIPRLGWFAYDSLIGKKVTHNHAQHPMRRDGILPQLCWWVNDRMLVRAYDALIGKSFLVDSSGKRISDDSSQKGNIDGNGESMAATNALINPNRVLSSKIRNPLNDSTREALAKENTVTKDELYYEMVLRNNKTFGFTNNYFVNLSRLGVLAASITGGILLLLLGLNNFETIDDASSNERLMLEAAIWLIAGSLGFSRLINGEVQQEVDSDEWRATFKKALDKAEHDKTTPFSYLDALSSPISANPLPQLLRYVPAGLEFKKVDGDGHCFFAAVGVQTGGNAKDLRDQAASHMEKNFKEFKAFFVGSEDEFRAHIAVIKNGKEWAGNLEIRALAKHLKRPIVVVQPDKCYYEQPVNDEEDLMAKDKEPIFLHYNGYNHYDALTLLSGASWQKVLQTIRDECIGGLRGELTPASPTADTKPPGNHR